MHLCLHCRWPDQALHHGKDSEAAVSVADKIAVFNIALRSRDRSTGQRHMIASKPTMIAQFLFASAILYFLPDSKSDAKGDPGLTR